MNHRLILIAVMVFPGEIYRAPRSWPERNYHKLIYWNEVAVILSSQPWNFF